MTKVIINADDLGINSKVNSAISKALEKGHISSSTILANSTTWDEIRHIVECNKSASFGVHLNLTQGKAITNSEILQKYGITDDNNNFSDWRKKNLEFTQELLEAIYEEWDAQVHRIVYENRIPVTHIDGHHHIHTLDVLQPCLLRLVKKHNIKAVRNRYTRPFYFLFNKSKKALPKNDTIKAPNTKSPKSVHTNKSTGPIRRIVGILKMKYSQVKWTSRTRKIAVTTDYFDSYENICKEIYRGCVLPKNCTIELMCHPGHEKYEFEYSLIESGALQSAGTKINLISYREII
ncbi:MAG: ChbG/HpnK family deacetylase [Bacteroidaceae bacterium]|nr:ChbG/HpnK family deacetylase [Bacteroidaceae bacterium]